MGAGASVFARMARPAASIGSYVVAWVEAQMRRITKSADFIGAGEGARTLDPDLGKVVLYH